jgi:hypothetical protein
MNPVAFLDELVKLDAMRPLVEKHAHSVVDGLYGLANDFAPPALPLRPDDAKTRLPRTGHRPKLVPAGHLGEVTPAKDPIDRMRFNEVLP